MYIDKKRLGKKKQQGDGDTKWNEKGEIKQFAIKSERRERERENHYSVYNYYLFLRYKPFFILLLCPDEKET